MAMVWISSAMASSASTEQLEVFFDGKADSFHFFVDHTCVPHTLELLRDDGDVVITGSLVTSKFPKAGDLVRFEAGALGAVDLQVD